MKTDEFYAFRSPNSTARLAEWANDKMELEQIVCPVDKDHRRGGKRLTDLSVILPGGAVQDFVWTWYSECLAQDHVLELLRASGFTGFEVKPVKAEFKRATDRRPPRLWEIVVTGWAGMAPPESGIKLVKHCDACGNLGYSACTHPDKIIDASQWDGSDFFIVWPLPAFIFVTGRVADTIRDHRLMGTALKPPGSLEVAGSGFSPGRLSYWMPETRARALGKPLGID